MLFHKTFAILFVPKPIDSSCNKDLLSDTKETNFYTIGAAKTLDQCDIFLRLSFF